MTSRTLASAGLLFALFALFGETSPAHAAAGDAAVQEGGALFKEGLQLYGAGDFDHAREKFARAHALLPKSSAILWNLALAEASSAHAPEALIHFRAYEHHPSARPKDVSEAHAKWMPQLEAQVGQLQVDGADGAAVTIDGGDAGVLPFATAVPVAPGPHHVEAVAGAVRAARDVSVAAGQTVSVHMAASAEPVPAAPAPAPVPAPAATTASPPPLATPAPPPPASDTTAAPVAHDGTSAARIGLTIGLGVAAAAALGTGIYFGTQSNNEGNTAQQIRAGLSSSACAGASPAPSCGALSSALNSENQDHTASIVLYAGAGVLAAGALATWLFFPKGSDARSIAMPYVGPGVVGAAWAARF